MRKFLLMSSALVAGGLLNGLAEAACIQTPICSSLGYTSSSACDGGIKCPFGNAWNCTGPNNTTEINKLKSEISSIKTDISNIQTNITDLTNRITNIENNSGSGTGGYSLECLSCSIGNIYYNGSCYDINSGSQYFFSGGYLVYAKEDGKCKAASLTFKTVTIRDVTDADWELVDVIHRACSTNMVFNQLYRRPIPAKGGVETLLFIDGKGDYENFKIYRNGCNHSDSYTAIGVSGGYTYIPKAEFEDRYYSTTLPVPEAISF